MPICDHQSVTTITSNNVSNQRYSNLYHTVSVAKIQMSILDYFMSLVCMVMFLYDHVLYDHVLYHHHIHDLMKHIIWEMIPFFIYVVWSKSVWLSSSPLITVCYPLHRTKKNARNSADQSPSCLMWMQSGEKESLCSYWQFLFKIWFLHKVTSVDIYEISYQIELSLLLSYWILWIPYGGQSPVTYR